jgi:hypothetical protein
LLVESTILSCVLSITLEYVCVEELTVLSHTTSRWVGIVSRTCDRAASSIEGAGCPKQILELIGIARAISLRCVDDRVSEVSWSSVASGCVDRSVDIAVAACNNHMELVAVLPDVQCIGLANRSSPIDALLRNVSLSVKQCILLINIYLDLSV